MTIRANHAFILHYSQTQRCAATYMTNMAYPKSATQEDKVSNVYVVPHPHHSHNNAHTPKAPSTYTESGVEAEVSIA